MEGPLLIVAGPGSGKTRTLTHRIAHLVAERGVAAESCLAITFTRRAAAEMKERLARLLANDAGRVAIHTFHSLGLAILREHAGAAGLQRGFRIAGEAERIAVLAEALDVTEPKAERLLRAISKAKRSPGAASADVAEAMSAYGRALALRNWIDFDDLVALPIRALTADAGLAARYRDRFRWIAADEFQDVDEQQYRLLTLLAPANGNLCVIGDPDQAIYGFRGADASCFERFKRDYPAAKVVRLARNYRSTGTIVTASAQVIAARQSEPLAEIVREMHERIAIHAAPTERAEAEFGRADHRADDRRRELLRDRQRPRERRGGRQVARSPTSRCSTAPTPSPRPCARPLPAPASRSRPIRIVRSRRSPPSARYCGSSTPRRAMRRFRSSWQRPPRG